MTRGQALRQRFGDEGGLALPEVMVSILVTAASMGVIVGMVMTLGSVYIGIAARSDVTVQQQTTENRLQRAGASAAELHIQDSRNVAFAQVGDCQNSTWAIDVAGKITETNTGVVSPDGACDRTATSTSVLMANAGADAGFTFANAAGRGLDFTGAVAEPAPTPRPADVAEAEWNSTAVATVALRGTTSTDSAYASSFGFVTDLPRARPWAGAQTHAVPVTPTALMVTP